MELYITALASLAVILGKVTSDLGQDGTSVLPIAQPPLQLPQCCPCPAVVLVCPPGCCPCSCIIPVCPPLPHIVFPPPAPWDQCVDDFKTDRVNRFNLVDSAKIIATLNRPNECLHYLWKRVLIGNRSLSKDLPGSVRIENLLLREACLVQTITVNSLSQLTAECSERNNTCLVWIPCVVPRILLTYNYDLGPSGTREAVTGRLVLEVKSDPVTLTVSIERDNRGVCVLNRLDERVLVPYEVVSYFESQNPYTAEIERIITDFVDRGWPFNLYKEEVKLFAFEVIEEAYRENTRLFLPVEQLRRFCTDIRIE